MATATATKSTPKAPKKAAQVKAGDTAAATTTNGTPHKYPTKDTAELVAKIRAAANRIKHASDPTRLHVLYVLSTGEMNVTALCQRVGQSQPGLSHHLAILRHSGMVFVRRDGKNNQYNLTDEGRALATAALPMIVG